MSTQSWDYLQRIEAIVANIRLANGYLTEAGAQTTLEPYQAELDGASRIVVMEDTRTRPADPAMSGVGRQLSIAIIGQVPKRLLDARHRLHQIADDIESAMDSRALQAKHLGAVGEWPSPRYQETSFVPPVDGMNWVGVAVRYTAALRRRATPTAPTT